MRGGAVGRVMRLKGIPGARFGAIVEGVDLSASVAPETVASIRHELHRQRLLVFRNQGRITGDRQVQISEWFGRLESTFSRHPRSPHHDIFRVSNDQTEG